MEKCLLCGRNADKSQKDKTLTGLCNNCIVEIKRKTKNTSPSENSLSQRLQNLQKRIRLIQKRLDILINNYFADNSSATPKNKTPTTPKNKTSTASKYQPIKNAVSTKKQSPSIKFNGEIRSLDDSDKKDSIQCPYCKLSIDKQLYLYPLAIHQCGDGYYHRKCFAKLMAEGNYKCLSCHQNLFEHV